ncbi:putative 1-phosphatidylinositol-3-phosphate 5-kinase FAB1C isoform X2 [Populus nigra]|uniref:putative 1-phosphatidylinositol-3-phosphate 5-kinase FAB1C isoform X2 n=1 Tax=Populus nigra TaxID=3691 RepID=UPI002B271A0A|nr:putative 1-phosphatidylinositol-3-phosphate 5-kinase FAB1C isoform X2 [Populus nigra]
MGIPDSSLFYLLHKVRSWISWGASDLSPSCLSANFEMPNNDTVNMCSECDSNNNQFFNGYHCQSCGKRSCFNCMRGYQSDVVNCNGDFGEAIKYCKFCNGVTVKRDGGRKNNEKVHPTDSPRGSPEPPSPSFSAASIQSDHLVHYLESRDCGFSPNTISSRSMTSFSAHPSPVSVRRSSSRSDEEEAGDSGKLFYSPLSEYSHDISDIDSSSVSARLEFCNCKSVGSSPLDSPSRIDFSSYRVGHTVQRGREGTSLSQSDGPFDKENMVILRGPDKRTEDPENADDYSDDVSVLRDQYDKSQKPLDFESNGLIWFPPPPEDENDETESSFFTYDDEDDDIGDSSAIFLPSSSLSCTFPSKENQNEINKDPLKAVIQGHFRALVAQLLQGEGIKASKEETNEEWLDIVTTIAWQAANFVKPDTSRGGSMDPVDYVKVKCIASGNPSDSTLVKGVVCTKNIKHKRMTTQYKNPRLLLLGGALEYQSVVNQLASFNTLVQKENDHLKLIMSKIEALRPNVLLVEKSVSPFAQEYLLGKEISLVLNVKRPLLERIAQCTGAYISPSFENISTTRLGHCELFRVERVFEEHETSNQFNKKPSKTLMFFEGCPRRLGCTVLLRGTCREELKKVKHVIQYAVFAAYHLSLETSFLADEGASLPKQTVRPSIAIPERTAADESISVISPITCHAKVALSAQDNDGSLGVKPEHEGSESLTGDLDAVVIPPLSPCSVTCKSGNELSIAYHGDLVSDVGRLDSFSISECEGLKISVVPPPGIDNLSLPELQDMMAQEGGQLMGTRELVQPEKIDEDEVSSEYFSATDTYQSILVSFSSRCVLKGTVCERSRLLRIKFYGSFDKPLGRYLRDDLFNQKSCCKSCKELAEAHVLCFTHQQGNLTINVRSLSSVKLPGERDGKIWMWHRCLRCAHIDGVPPATRRVVMSAAAWGLSFGKFLELSFSNHATANRVAPCGHSLQRDCLRFYGFGSMVAFFRYSPIDILNVHLPPSVLEFNSTIQHEWIRKEASELLGRMETFYGEISGVLDSMEQRSKYFGGELSDTNELQSHITELKDQLLKEKDDYNVMLQLAVVESSDQTVVDILELNRIRRALLIGSHVWDQKLFSLDSVLKTNSVIKAKEGTNQLPIKVQPLHAPQADADGFQPGPVRQPNLFDNPPFRRMMAPLRVHSFDSALRVQERIQKGLPPSMHLSTIRSFHASGDYRSMLRDPVSAMRTYSQTLPLEVQKLNLIPNSTRTFISSAANMAGGARLLLPMRTNSDIVIGVYDNDPASVVSYALSSKEYEDWVTDRSNENGGIWSTFERSKEGSAASSFTAWQSFGSVDLDYISYGGYGSEDPSSSLGNLFMVSKKSPHLTISYGDDSSFAGGKVKFSVTCYFAKQFDSLRRKCCPSDVDFVRSLSRCQKWSAQGGKSNVYFAKSLDERFIIKQIKKTELESFEEFALEYFKYLTDSLNSGSPTCLAKILGIYQVTVKHLRGGKETKMDLMVMENLFFNRNIARVYDLKGSSRSRYNPDTSGSNKVLLDMNLVETLRTDPIFLGSKAKRSLERAIWNDTSFLASVDVMDYSLLVGVDDERKELVLGIIDFMRQYTWDKHLETWVKASGILGGPKNASPTIVSPKQYKKRFRKAMTSYFLTVPDQWSS